MTKRPTSDADETRSGFRSGEGTESVLHHLMASARRRKQNSPFADSHASTQPFDDGDTAVDVPLP